MPWLNSSDSIDSDEARLEVWIPMKKHTLRTEAASELVPTLPMADAGLFADALLGAPRDGCPTATRRCAALERVHLGVQQPAVACAGRCAALGAAHGTARPAQLCGMQKKLPRNVIL